LIGASARKKRAPVNADALQRGLARFRRSRLSDGSHLRGARWWNSVHVWVDETRPRSQGSKLTAWELGEHGVPPVIADNAGRHLMQHGKVDAVIVGTDRTTYTGMRNKIDLSQGARGEDNAVPFYAAPLFFLDWNIRDGLKEIPIEERGAEEVSYADGWRDGEQVGCA
jgi:methylthioribose-1-phosphate isomerase